MVRKRALSKKGWELFNVASNISPTNTCLKTLFFNFITSDFDVKLEKSQKSFRLGSCSLYSYLNKKDRDLIPTFFNNALANLVYLILADDNKVNSLKKVKQNIHFYYSLAELAFKNNDHNSVILLKAALEDTAIKRLKIKHSKKEVKLIKMFEDNYGTFMNCNAKHLEKILETDDVLNFLPSVVIILMHLNKTKEYSKCYESLGKFPKSLRDKQKKLSNIVNKYYINYRELQDDLLELYFTDPNDLLLLQDIDEKSITIKLIQLSKKIKR